eukprot:s2522_g4.t1
MRRADKIKGAVSPLERVAHPLVPPCNLRVSARERETWPPASNDPHFGSFVGLASGQRPGGSFRMPGLVRRVSHRKESQCGFRHPEGALARQQ